MRAHQRDCLLSRRSLVTGAGAAGVGLLRWPGDAGISPALGQETQLIPELVIDLSGDPESIDPAIAYAARDWSVVHSVYDALVGIASDGTIQPLAAEAFEAIDDVTFEATLREGMTFHDGSPVTAEAVIRGVDHLQQGDSKVIDLFRPIVKVEAVDDLTVRIVCDAPSPWLPAQMAVWHVLLPEGATSESMANAPVGSGPYVFASYDHGSNITLTRHSDYVPSDVKGAAIAEKVVYRFVPDAATRVADLSTDSAHIVAEVPQDQAPAVEDSGSAFVSSGVVGSGWIRIATDVEPFSDVRVRQALNLALDIDSIAQSLVSPDAHRLASIHPDDRSMGFDDDLAPYAFDPEQATALLAEAGYEDGFDTVLETTTAASRAVAEAISAQLGEVGIRVTLQASEYATFNATWTEPTAPPLRMVTWSPLFDPHTLLSLVFATAGFLSRYDNADANALITEAASEVDPEARAAMYRDLASVMHEDAPAIFLWNLVSNYGVAEIATAWQPRGDEYVLALGQVSGASATP
jgi:peptide/nickel transport system substrate-binding protein